MHSKNRKKESEKLKRKLKLTRLVSIFSVSITCLLTVVNIGIWKGAKSANAALMSEKQLTQHYRKEVSILRTLSPYSVEVAEVLELAQKDQALYPGWVVRAYPLPEHAPKNITSSPLGMFMLNETHFSMASHQNYGIEQPSKTMYRMSGLMPSKSKGSHQVGVVLFIKDSGVLASTDIFNGIASCYVKVEVNQQAIIDKHVRIFTRYNMDKTVTGDIELDVGLYPIDVLLYCDRQSDFNGKDVEVEVLFREANQPNLVNNPYSVFHIYNPNDMEGKL